MPARRTHLAPETTRGSLAAALTALRDKNGVSDEFPADVLAEAREAEAPVPALDLREIPFVTLDPPDSRDLDQAFHLERTGNGFTLRYAIADVPGVVRPGRSLDAEARRRGQTLYLPDGSVPLHPRELSEDRASLLPDVDRVAYVWTIPVDAMGAAAFEDGEAAAASVERALIRSRAKLGYGSAQASLDAGTASGPLALLPEFAALRIAQEQRRGGASLNMADEEVVRDETGYRIERRFPLPVEEWNSQLSLLTGMLAGRMMLDGGIGILRTMAAPDEQALAEFRDRVAVLGVPWREALTYGEYLRELPRGTPQAAAVLHAASSLFRGADYAAFGVERDGEMLPPAGSSRTGGDRRTVRARDRTAQAPCGSLGARRVPGLERGQASPRVGAREPRGGSRAHALVIGAREQARVCGARPGRGRARAGSRRRDVPRCGRRVEGRQRPRADH